MDTKFMFQLSPMDTAALLPQVSCALEKRVELHSRARLPGIWPLIDRLNSVKKAPADVLRRRKRRQTVLWLLCLLMGMFLMVPSLLDPVGLRGPLVVSIIVVISAVVSLWHRQKKLLGVLCLLMGAFLLAVARGAPQEMGVLLAPGVAGVLLGLTALLPRRKSRFDREARRLLLGKDTIPEGQTLHVIFSTESVTLSGSEQTACGVQGDNRHISYADLLYAVETDDLFFLACERSCILLQKKDLTTGSLEDFRAFISTRAAYSPA